MDPNAPSYIERRADSDLLDALLEGDYVFVLDSRQKGKSSLVARTIVKLKEKGVATVKLDLQRLGANLTAEQWYGGLLAAMGQELGMQPALLEYWRSHLEIGPLSRWLGALETVVLNTAKTPIVIFIDEVDYVRALPFPADEFFAGIRDCYNRRSEAGGFERLTFCLVGVATPGQLIRNPEITPFNIGRRIDLTDFSLEETSGYASVLAEGGRNGGVLVQRVHHWVSGHPYLTQLLCSHVAGDTGITSKHGVDRLVKELFFTREARQKVANFADVERRMLDPDVPGVAPDEKRSQVLDLYGRLLRGRGVPTTEENPVAASLRLAGLGYEDHGVLKVRNEAYRRVFDERWRRQSLPEGELRRQRGAARIAVLRTASVAGVLVLAVTSGAIGMWRISGERQEALNKLAKTSNERKEALSTLENRNGELTRISGERKAALNSLQLRTTELARVSNQRQQALVDLQGRSFDLKRTLEERNRAVHDLEKSADELRRTSYMGIMVSLRLAMQENRWMKVAELMDRSRDDPLRGWEWGHLAAMLNGQVAEAQVQPLRNEFEEDPDGTVSLITRDSIFKVTPTGLQLRRKFKGKTIFPLIRRGNLRSGVDPETGKLVIRDADTDQIVAESALRIMSFDPDTRTMIVQWGGGDTEKRSFDGKVLEHYPRPDPARKATMKLPNGDEISLFRDGLLIRTDSKGSRAAETKILPPPLAGNQYFVRSKDGTLFMLIDQGAPRPFQIRRASDLSVTSTLEAPTDLGAGALFAPDKRSILLTSGGVITRYDVGSGKVQQNYYGHQYQVFRVVYLPGGTHFASIDRMGAVRIWPLEPLPAVKSLGAIADPPVDFWLGDDPRFLLYPTVEGALESRNLKTGEVARIESPAGVHSQEPFSVVSGKRVYVGTDSGTVDRYSIDGLKKEKSVKVFDSMVFGIGRLMGGKRLLVRSNTGKPAPGMDYAPHTQAEYAILDTESMAVLHRFRPNWPLPGVNYGGLMTSDGPIFAVRASKWWTGPLMPTTAIILLVSAESGKILRRMEFPKQDITASALSADGKWLILSFYTGLNDSSSRIEVFDTSSGKRVKNLEIPTGVAVRSFWVKGSLLVGTLADDTIGVWDLSKGPRCTVLAPGQAINFYDISPDCSRVLVCLKDGTLIVYDPKSGVEFFSQRDDSAGNAKDGQTEATTIAGFSKDGSKIFLFGKDGVLRSLNSVPWKTQPKAARK